METCMTQRLTSISPLRAKDVTSEPEHSSDASIPEVARGTIKPGHEKWVVIYQLVPIMIPEDEWCDSDD
jgi:hypothetical protein